MPIVCALSWFVASRVPPLPSATPKVRQAKRGWMAKTSAAPAGHRAALVKSSVQFDEACRKMALSLWRRRKIQRGRRRGVAEEEAVVGGVWTIRDGGRDVAVQTSHPLDIRLHRRVRHRQRDGL